MSPEGTPLKLHKCIRCAARDKKETFEEAVERRAQALHLQNVLRSAREWCEEQKGKGKP